MKTLSSFAMMLTAGAIALTAAPAFAADDCSACNSVNKVAECCRAKAGCTTQMAPKRNPKDVPAERAAFAAENVNVCVASKEAPSKPAMKVTAKECQKQYSSCLSRLNARRGEFVSGKGKKRTGKASDWLDVLKQGRTACQSRLKACRGMVQ